MQASLAAASATTKLQCCPLPAGDWGLQESGLPRVAVGLSAPTFAPRPGCLLVCCRCARTATIRILSQGPSTVSWEERRECWQGSQTCLELSARLRAWTLPHCYVHGPPAHPRRRQRVLSLARGAGAGLRQDGAAGAAVQPAAAQRAQDPHLLAGRPWGSTTACLGSPRCAVHVACAKTSPGGGLADAPCAPRPLLCRNSACLGLLSGCTCFT